MIEVTFLNVDQGDSIVLKYKKEDDTDRVIIIDSNKTLEENKTIKYLRKNNIRSIDYIILSHPHYDHFSGLLDVLEYIIENKIKIGTFFFTGKQQPDFLLSACRNSKEATNKLQKLLKKVVSLANSGILEYNTLEASDISSFKLNSEIKLKLLSPTSYEDINFTKTINTEVFSNSDIKNHPAGNWLSTVFEIITENWSVLLTSDCLKDTLIRLDKKNKLSNKNILVAQSAHHGAVSSHNNTFWKNRLHERQIKIVFSVGENKYKHPNEDVVYFFIQNNFEVYSTNRVGCLVNYPNIKKPTKELEENKIYLNTFSSQSIYDKFQSNLKGDKTFRFNKEGILT